MIENIIENFDIVYDITLTVLFLAIMFMLVFRRPKSPRAKSSKESRARDIIHDNIVKGNEEHRGKDGI